jgi:hypothetical protein
MAVRQVVHDAPSHFWQRPAEELLGRLVEVGHATLRVDREQALTHTVGDGAQVVARLQQRALGEDARGHIDMGYNDACLAAPGIARGVHYEPTLDRRAVTWVLERELRPMPCQDRTQTARGLRRALHPNCGVGHREVVLLARTRTGAVLVSEPRPRTVGHDDRSSLVEYRDVGHERVERRLEKVA